MSTENIQSEISFNSATEEAETINIKNNKASFNVSALTKGIYILKIDIDGKTESHQIGVK